MTVRWAGLFIDISCFLRSFVAALIAFLMMHIFNMGNWGKQKACSQNTPAERNWNTGCGIQPPNPPNHSTRPPNSSEDEDAALADAD